MLPFVQKVVRLLMIVALFAAIGGHWAMLQTAAWSAMLVKYSLDTDLASAVEQTFDGRHPCPLCKKIAEGRHNEKKQDTQVVLSKLKFCCELVTSQVLPPRNFWQMQTRDTFSPALAHQPPVPPPRLLPG